MSPDVSATDLRSEAGRILPRALLCFVTPTYLRHAVDGSVLREVNLQFIEVCVKTKGDGDF